MSTLDWEEQAEILVAINIFTFTMKVNPCVANILLLTNIVDDKDRKFYVLVDGVKIAYVEWNCGTTGKFYDSEYIISQISLATKPR
jgi:hypothetical protein